MGIKKHRWVLEEAIIAPFGADGREDRLKFLNLIRSAMKGIDRLVDAERHSPECFKRCQSLIAGTWAGKRPRTRNRYENELVSAIRILRRFFDNGFYPAELIYKDFLKGYQSEYENALTRNRILSSEKLEELNTIIGLYVVTMFIHFLVPYRNKEDYQKIENIVDSITRRYGLAIKEADNVWGFYTDILDEGFITIPKEDISNVVGLTLDGDNVLSIDKDRLRINPNYIARRKERIEDMYKEADGLLEENAGNLGLNRKQVGLFKQWIHSWLKEE